MSDALHDTHPQARDEARRLIGTLIRLLDEGEHLGVPQRMDQRIVIPIEEFAPGEGPDDSSIRALLAAWLDTPPPRTE